MTATINASTTAGVVTTADTSGILQLQTNGTAALTVDASQNTTLAGTLTTTGVTTFAAGTAALPAITTTGDTNTGIFFPAADTIAFAEGGAEVMRINSRGNVGVGTSSPAVRLHVSGSSTYVAGIEGSSTFALMGFKASGTTGTLDDANVALGATGDALYFRAGGSERARIDSSGNFIFGATSTAAPSLNYRPSSDGGYFTKNADTTGATTAYDFLINGSRVGAITTAGSNTTYSTSSDYRLKEAIAPMTGALAMVTLLKPVTYKWKVDGSDGRGFIAHELQEVVPECVVGEKDAVDAEGNPQYQGIDTSFLVATLTAAIQELKAIVDAQGAEIAALKGATA